MAFTLYTQSFGPLYANGSVLISDSVTGVPATILASASGGVVNTQGQATLDSNGNLAVYIDTARTYNINAFDGVALNTAPTYLTNAQLNAGATGVLAASSNGFIDAYGNVVSGNLTNTQATSLSAFISGVSVVNATKDGSVDTSSFFTAAVQAVANTSTIGVSGLTDQRSRAVIEIPPGQYLITQINGMLGSEVHSVKTIGLTFRGAGRGSVQIIFQPSTAGALCTNNKWLDVRFEGIEFISKTAGCTLFTTPGTSNEQEYTFEHCNFWNWKYVMYLVGTNNNSEVLFFRCGNFNMEQAGAWLFIPSSGAVDQFLNYWFKSCKHWTTSAPIVDIAFGGHVSLEDIDCSNWGGSAVASPATPDQGTYLFRLRGNNHNFGSMRFAVKEIRVEMVSANARFLYSEWGGYGAVSLKGVDLSSQSANYTYGSAVLYLLLPNSSGSAYLLEDCPALVGGISVEYSANAWQMDHRIRISNCSWLQKVGPSDVITYIPTGNHSNANVPTVEFDGCRSNANAAYNFSAATAFPVWDSSIGSVSIPAVSYGSTGVQLKKRAVMVNSVYGGLQGTDVAYIRLPLGALITGCSATCSVGGSSQGTAGTWTVQADKAGTPTTISTLTTPGALSAGFNIGGALSAPFKCSTAAKSIISITPSSVTAAGDTIVFIEGYW